MGALEFKLGSTFEKKCHVKFEEEEWQPTRINGKRYQTKKENKGASYVEVVDTEEDIKVLEVTDKVMKRLEIVIEGLDLQPIGPKYTKVLACEIYHGFENNEVLKEFQEFLAKNIKEERPEIVPKTSMSTGRKRDMIFGMIRDTLVMLKAMNKILCDMDAKINKEA